MFIAAACRRSSKEPAKGVVERGKATNIKTLPADGGALWDVKDPITIIFANPVEPDVFSFSCKPDPGGWQSRWNQDKNRVVLTHTQPFAANGSYEMRLAAGSDKAQLRFRVFGPNSLALIDQAEKKGELDLDTAWIYRFFALFNRKALPAPYQSATPIPDGDGTLAAFSAQKNKLKPETLKQLRPYLVRPDHPESVFYPYFTASDKTRAANRSLIPLAYAQEEPGQRPNQPYKVKCASAPILVHSSQRMRSKANEVKGLIDQYIMYERFKNLVNTFPPPDTGASDGDGGDENLDIYILPADDVWYWDKEEDEEGAGDGTQVRSTAAGICWPTEYGNCISSSKIFISQVFSGKELGSLIAHELFHAFQHAIDVSEERWWMESTATWAEDHIDDRWNTEQENLSSAFDIEKHMLDSINKENGEHEYGIYLFPYYLSQKHGELTVGEVWMSCKCGQTVWQALEAISKGKFKDWFKDFCYLVLDKGPAKGSFEDTNGALPLFDLHGVQEFTLEKSEVESEVQMTFETEDIPQLSALYWTIENKIDPEVLPEITFYLQGFPKDCFSIIAVLDPDGNPRRQDWSGLEQRVLCMNRPDEKFKKIALVIINHCRDKTFPATDLDVSAFPGCAEREGTATFTAHEDYKDKDNTLATSATVQGKLTLTGKEIKAEENEVWEYYDFEAIKVRNFTLSGSDSLGCVYSGRQKEAAPKSVPLLVVFDEKTGNAKRIGLPSVGVMYEMTVTCPEMPSQTLGGIFSLAAVSEKEGESIKAKAEVLARRAMANPEGKLPPGYFNDISPRLTKAQSGSRNNLIGQDTWTQNKEGITIKRTLNWQISLGEPAPKSGKN